MIDAKKLIERSKGKLKMVVQRDERATLLNIPDLDDSIPSANASDRDGKTAPQPRRHLPLTPPCPGADSHSCFRQTFQISILWRPTIPIDHMTDAAAAAPAPRTAGRSPPTTPDTPRRRSATAGKPLHNNNNNNDHDHDSNNVDGTLRWPLLN